MKTKLEIDLFNDLFDYYGIESDTWKAVKFAVENNMTASEVIKLDPRLY